MTLRIRHSQQGFGLIELMVSIGVMVLVTSIVLVRQSAFNSAVLLENQAYEIAFDIRQTQLRAVSAQGGIDADFRTQYGVTFVPGERQYYFFRGDPGDGTFLGAPGRLDRRFSIVAVQTPSGDDVPGGAHVVFARPEYNAHFFRGDGVALDEDWLNIYACADNDDSNTAERVLEMAVGSRDPDLRYDMNNDGNITSGDALDVARLKPNNGCNFRRIRVTNTGQITVN